MDTRPSALALGLLLALAAPLVVIHKESHNPAIRPLVSPAMLLWAAGGGGEAFVVSQCG